MSIVADNQPSLGAPSAPSEDGTTIREGFILPSNSTASVFRTSSSLTPLVCDERAIARLLETLLSRGGLTIGEASRRMGVTTNTIRQYLRGRRNKPSLIWFIRLADLCGAKVTIEFPK